MDNLKKLAERLIDEADHLASMIMHDPSKHLKELDIIFKLCDTHSGICESLEIDEVLDDDDHAWGDMHRKRR